MLRPGQAIILITLTLLVIGVVMVTSAGLTIDEQSGPSLVEVLTGRTAIVALLAVIALVAGMLVPVHRIMEIRGPVNPAPWIVIGLVILLALVHVPGIGREVNGARRWITLGPVGFQPSELVKWGVLVVLAWYAARWPERLGRLFKGFAPPLIVTAVLCGLIATEDLGTAVLIGAVAVAVLIAGGARIGHALLLLPAAALGFAAAVWQSPYRLRRLETFLDPFADPRGDGYHMIQAMATVSGGGMAGHGLGNGVHKFGYLPEDTTDFIFAIICEEFGIVGASLVVFLYALLCLSGLAIIRNVREPFLRLLGLGIVLTIGLQALINLAVVTGCGPTKGIALPLISWGGTGWVMTCFCLGVLVGMDKRAGFVSSAPERPPAAPRFRTAALDSIQRA